MNSALAAGLIIDNYLAGDAEYYIGNSIKQDTVVNNLISEYEYCLINKMPVPKELFDEAAFSIRQQLDPLLKEFNNSM